MADDKPRSRDPLILKDFEFVPRQSVVQTFRKGDTTKGMTRAAIDHGISIGAIADTPAAKE